MEGAVSQDRGAVAEVTGGHGRPTGTRTTRFNPVNYVPDDLDRALELLQEEQPRTGYPDKNAVMGVLNRLDFDAKGERDDLYRFIRNHAALLCPDGVKPRVHVCDPVAADNLLKACVDGTVLPTSTEEAQLARYLFLLYSLGYRPGLPGRHEGKSDKPKAAAPSGKLSLPSGPLHTVCDLLGMPDLLEQPELLRTLSNAELDQLTGGVTGIWEQGSQLLDHIVADKRRREDEAEASRQREAERRRLADEARVAEEAVLKSMELADQARRGAEAARTLADKAVAEQRAAEQALENLRRQQASL